MSTMMENNIIKTIKTFTLSKFVKQNQRADVVTNMLLHLKVPGNHLFRLIMTDNATAYSDYTRQAGTVLRFITKT